MKTSIFILLLFISCGNNNDSSVVTNYKADSISTPVTSTESGQIQSKHNDPLEVRKCAHIDSLAFKNEDSLRKILIESFSEDFGNINDQKINFNTSLSKENIQIEKFGVCDLYTITLSGNLPAMISRKMSLFYSKVQQKAVLLPFEDLYLLKTHSFDDFYLLAGMYIVKAKGFFVIYRFDNKDQFNLIFDSFAVPDCENGIPVINASLDCISYDPYMMRFQNIDRNKDGLNDLIFTGTVNSYCKGLEYNIGRNDRKPIRSEKVEIIFNTYLTKDSLSWQLADTTICSKLTHSF